MTPANEITGVIALTLMLLVCRGFAPHMHLRGRDPVVLLMQGVFIGSAVIAARVAIYDVAMPALQSLQLIGGDPMPMPVEYMNAAFNFGFAVGAWRVLVALHASLPPEDQAAYSWLTAPFYPKQFWLFGGKTHD